MTINYGFSLRGISHELIDKPCQDFHKYETLDNGYTIIASCDGVGSAKFAEKGSKLVAETAVEFCKENFPYDGNRKCIESMIRMAFNKAMLEVISLAKQEEQDVREYDTTLDLVVYNGISLSWGHVGDSGIIALNAFDGKYEALTTRQKGEDQISMIPLRFGSKYWVIESSNEEYAAVLLATDGILDNLLAPTILKNQPEKLNISELRKFMDKTFNGVNKDNVEEFQSQVIEVFSDEKQFLNVTTDDKTVVVSISEELTPEILDDEYYQEPDWKSIIEEINARIYGFDIEADDEACGEEADNDDNKQEPKNEADDREEFMEVNEYKKDDQDDCKRASKSNPTKKIKKKIIKLISENSKHMKK
ncbi:MAG: protein phosphatase 2C domain-containing protein [Intestinibacter sp.]